MSLFLSPTLTLHGTEQKQEDLTTLTVKSLEHSGDTETTLLSADFSPDVKTFIDLI